MANCGIHGCNRVAKVKPSFESIVAEPIEDMPDIEVGARWDWSGDHNNPICQYHSQMILMMLLGKRYEL